MDHLSAPRGTLQLLAHSSVTGFGAAGTERVGQFQSELKECLGCSLPVSCIRFCPLCPQSFGLSFCEWLFSVVSLRVSGCAMAGKSRLSQCPNDLIILGHFVWDSNQKCKKGG